MDMEYSNGLRDATCNERMCKRCKNFRADTGFNYRGEAVELSRGTCHYHHIRLPWNNYDCDNFTAK